jgi:ubiquinone/menaquinone biosynthesis C-methylase UbiE
MGLSLNIGSGDKLMRDINGHTCINIDIRELPDNDKYKGVAFVRGDVRNLPFPDEHFDAILASDIIEHFPKTETKTLIKEWTRVLKCNGLLKFRTPSLQWAARHYLQTGEAEFVSYHIFGGQDYSGNFHYVIFDKKWLESICNEFGLVVVDYNENHSNFDMVVSKIKE